MVTSRKPRSVGLQFTAAAMWALEAGLLIPFVEKRGWKFSKLTEKGGSEVDKRSEPANRNRFERRPIGLPESEFRSQSALIPLPRIFRNATSASILSTSITTSQFVDRNGSMRTLASRACF